LAPEKRVGALGAERLGCRGEWAEALDFGTEEYFSASMKIFKPS
jgi:hypothetical protein